jgi:hypothetical protein
MLLLFSPVGDTTIPMMVINIHTGEPLMNIAYEGNLSEVEFIECFNESLLFKSKNKPLKTHDILTDKVKYI